jgi:hypothetical protein
MADKVVVLCHGRSVYFGSPNAAIKHFRMLGCSFEGANPADVILDYVGSHATKLPRFALATPSVAMGHVSELTIPRMPPIAPPFYQV